MHVVCVDSDLRNWLGDHFGLADAAHESIVISGSSNSVHAYFGTPDTVVNAVVGLRDLGENNLKYAIRYMLANAEKNIKLALVTYDWNDTYTNIDRLEQVIRTEYRRAESNNQAEMQKANALKDSRWKTDRLEQLQKWRTIPTFQYATFSQNNELKDEIKKYFADCRVRRSSTEEDQYISQKSPILHWTSTPLEGEMQIVVRFTFPLYGPDASLLRSIAELCRLSFDSVYQWIQGTLLTCEPVRVHAQLVTPTRLEVAARLCVDELEGDDARLPARLLWPYLSQVTRHAVSALESYPNMQYSTELILFGPNLFVPPVECRVFDLPTFMSTALTFGKVGFKMNSVHEVQLHQVFPGHIPKCMDDLTSDSPPSPKPHTNGVSPLVQDKVPPMESMGSSLTVAHNRGRRVSFGTIRCMDGEGAAQPVVDEYVDSMLRNTMDSLLSN